MLFSFLKKAIENITEDKKDFLLSYQLQFAYYKLFISDIETKIQLFNTHEEELESSIINSIKKLIVEDNTIIEKELKIINENINKLLLQKAAFEIELEKDNSKYGMPLPNELKTAWELDEEGYEVFHTLTIGKQRSLVYQIGKPKSSELRIRKALAMLEYLKSVNGNLDYKELNEAYKQANNR